MQNYFCLALTATGPVNPIFYTAVLFIQYDNKPAVQQTDLEMRFRTVNVTFLVTMGSVVGGLRGSPGGGERPRLRDCSFASRE